MAKKSAYREYKESEQIKRFQWEFLRRNSDYCKDYQALMNDFGDWFRKNGFWYDKERSYSEEGFEFFITVVAPRLLELCKKWQVNDPLPPDGDFSKNGLREYRPCCKVYLPIASSPESAGGWLTVGMELKALKLESPHEDHAEGSSPQRSTEQEANRGVSGSRMLKPSVT